MPPSTLVSLVIVTLAFISAMIHVWTARESVAQCTAQRLRLRERLVEASRSCSKEMYAAHETKLHSQESQKDKLLTFLHELIATGDRKTLAPDESNKLSTLNEVQLALEQSQLLVGQLKNANKVLQKQLEVAKNETALVKRVAKKEIEKLRHASPAATRSTPLNNEDSDCEKELVQSNTRRSGIADDVRTIIPSASRCKRICLSINKCKGWSYHAAKEECTILSTIDKVHTDPCCTSGKKCG